MSAKTPVTAPRGRPSGASSPAPRALARRPGPLRIVAMRCDGGLRRVVKKIQSPCNVTGLLKQLGEPDIALVHGVGLAYEELFYSADLYAPDSYDAFYCAPRATQVAPGDGTMAYSLAGLAVFGNEGFDAPPEDTAMGRCAYIDLGHLLIVGVSLPKSEDKAYRLLRSLREMFLAPNIKQGRQVLVVLHTDFQINFSREDKWHDHRTELGLWSSSLNLVDLNVVAAAEAPREKKERLERLSTVWLSKSLLPKKISYNLLHPPGSNPTFPLWLELDVPVPKIPRPPCSNAFRIAFAKHIAKAQSGPPPQQKVGISEMFEHAYGLAHDEENDAALPVRADDTQESDAPQTKKRKREGPALLPYHGEFENGEEDGDRTAVSAPIPIGISVSAPPSPTQESRIVLPLDLVSSPVAEPKTPDRATSPRKPGDLSPEPSPSQLRGAKTPDTISVASSISSPIFAEKQREKVQEKVSIRPITSIPLHPALIRDRDSESKPGLDFFTDRMPRPLQEPTTEESTRARILDRLWGGLPDPVSLKPALKRVRFDQPDTPIVAVGRLAQPVGLGIEGLGEDIEGTPDRPAARTRKQMVAVEIEDDDISDATPEPKSAVTARSKVPQTRAQKIARLVAEEKRDRRAQHLANQPGKISKMPGPDRQPQPRVKGSKATIDFLKDAGIPVPERRERGDPIRDEEPKPSPGGFGLVINDIEMDASVDSSDAEADYEELLADLKAKGAPKQFYGEVNDGDGKYIKRLTDHRLEDYEKREGVEIWTEGSRKEAEKAVKAIFGWETERAEGKIEILKAG